MSSEFEDPFQDDRPVDPFQAPPPPQRSAQRRLPPPSARSPPLTESLQALQALLDGHIPYYKLNVYLSALTDNFCDSCDIIADLTSAEMGELGIALGHRRTIIVAAKTLSAPHPPDAVASGGSNGVGGRTTKDPASVQPRAALEPANPLRGVRNGDDVDAKEPTAFPETYFLADHEARSDGSSSNSSHPPYHRPPTFDPSATLHHHDDKKPSNRTLERTSSSSSQQGAASRLSSFRRMRRGFASAQHHYPSVYSKQRIQEEIDSDAPPLGGRGEKHNASDPPTLQADALGNAADVEWLCICGNQPTLEQFLYDMNQLRKYRGFPPSFDRLFYNNKPMPFLELSPDLDMIGLLLRIPDLSDEYGTSITTITNRVCFMVHRTARLVVTYHACEEDPFDGFQREWEAGRHASTGIERIAETMIRRVLRTYNKGVAALREAVDELESREPGAAARRLDDTARVQRLSLIAKKSAVYKRCADATRETLAELEDVDWMEPFAKTLCDGLSTVASMTDELASNALASIDLTIALSEFKSNTNLKNFTYMSILLQPVGIATSWYGMNWAHMPELEYENAYYIFAGATWVVALLVFTRFVLRGMFLDAHKPTEPFAVHTAVAGATVDADGSAAECRPWRRASHVLPLVPHGGQQSRRATVSLLLDKADTCVTFRSSGAFPPESSLVEDDVQDVTVADVGPQHAEVSPSYPCDDASDVVFELNPLALHSKP